VPCASNQTANPALHNRSAAIGTLTITIDAEAAPSTTATPGRQGAGGDQSENQFAMCPPMPVPIQVGLGQQVDRELPAAVVGHGPVMMRTRRAGIRRALYYGAPACFSRR